MTESVEQPQPNHKRPSLHIPGFFGEVVRTIIFVVAVTVLFDMAIPRSLVDGQSMQPTFHDGDRLIVSRVHYLLTDPQRGDIIVFNSLDPREVGVMLIKRVIGVPGDRVEMREQQIYINGEQLDEDYIAEACRVVLCPDNTWELSENEYFVMGDNRNHSKDSRAFNAVPSNHIVGQVLFRYWPLPDIRLFNGQSYSLTDTID